MTLGITLGDPSGIGPEVALKAVARLVGDGDDDTRYVLLGNAGVVRHYCGLMGVDADLPAWSDASTVPARLYLQATDDLPVEAFEEQGGVAAAQSSLQALRDGARRCLTGDLAGLVTAPVSKQAIIDSGHPFTGQTEFLADIAACSRFAMMLLGHDDRGRWLRVALATTHLPLSAVAGALTAGRVIESVELAAAACHQLGLARQRVAVCGLNPHAGEGGHLGREELEIIAPAVAVARTMGFDVHGPAPADALFHRVFRGEFDAVVAMYHDQGLVPLKMVAFDTGVNWTLGLPFVRTSPDHGTAYDIAGRGIADPASMESALRLARQLAGAAARR
jgi:4-hydroxythreonine-4-phosphate dehydrogenase